MKKSGILSKIVMTTLFSLGVFGGFQWATNIFLTLVWFIIIATCAAILVPRGRKKLTKEATWNKYSTLYHFLLICGMIGTGWIFSGVAYTIAIYTCYIVCHIDLIKVMMEGYKDE